MVRGSTTAGEGWQKTQTLVRFQPNTILCPSVLFFSYAYYSPPLQKAGNLQRICIQPTECSSCPFFWYTYMSTNTVMAMHCFPGKFSSTLTARLLAYAQKLNYPTAEKHISQTGNVFPGLVPCNVFLNVPLIPGTSIGVNTPGALNQQLTTATHNVHNNNALSNKCGK
jgi:hypothetical protein